MVALPCAEHPGAFAAFGCDSCGRLLCSDCVEEGHRLLFCRHCGERALPLDRREATTTNVRRAEVARTAAAGYTWIEALTYPFRGYGAFAFWAYLVAIAVFVVIERLVIVGGCLTLVPRLILWALVAPFMFDIARTTARGENELPDWPDWDFWEAVKKMLTLGLVAATSLFPAYGLLALVGCGPADFVAGVGSAVSCTVLLGIGLVLSMMVWLLAFGSTAVYETPWLFFRLDLHARAGMAAGGDLGIATLINGLILGGVPGVWLVLAIFTHSIAAQIVSQGLTLYAMLLSAHLAGVIFRRQPDALEDIYLG